MGGQACIFYGAAEFSRDTDLAILASPENLRKLELALQDLGAVCIAVPPFSLDYLERGHAIHFRCTAPEADKQRIDIMSVMRGLDPFPVLWARRTTVTVSDSEVYELLSLPDLVLAKKTQRDKDWPMIRRLVEASYFQKQDDPSDAQLRFWFLELRTPQLLIELAAKYPDVLIKLSKIRPLLNAALSGDLNNVARSLKEEEEKERLIDITYWEPLKRELETLRRTRQK